MSNLNSGSSTVSSSCLPPVLLSIGLAGETTVPVPLPYLDSSVSRFCCDFVQQHFDCGATAPFLQLSFGNQILEQFPEFSTQSTPTLGQKLMAIRESGSPRREQSESGPRSWTYNEDEVNVCVISAVVVMRRWLVILPTNNYGEGFHWKFKRSSNCTVKRSNLNS